MTREWVNYRHKYEQNNNTSEEIKQIILVSEIKNITDKYQHQWYGNSNNKNK